MGNCISSNFQNAKDKIYNRALDNIPLSLTVGHLYGVIKIPGSVK